MPFCIIASNGVPAMIDWPTIDLLPGADRAVGADAALQPVHVDRPIVAAANVVLAQPEMLDRTMRRRTP